MSSNRFNSSDEDRADRQRATDVIKAEINRTRAEMDHTVEALQRRLDPQVMVHQVFDSFRGNAGDLTTKAFDIIKANPIPAALIGLGVVWLVVKMSRNSKRDLDRHDRFEHLGRHSPVQSDRRHARDVEGPSDVTYAEAFTETRISMGALRDHPKVAGSGCNDRSGSSRRSKSTKKSSSITQNMKHRSRDLGSQAMHRMQDMREYVGEHLHDGTTRAKDWFEQTVDEYPLAVGAAFFTLGLIGGFAIPSTPPENRYMGKARDRLFNQAQEYGSELIDKGQKVAENLVESVKESVSSERSASQPARRS